MVEIEIVVGHSRRLVDTIPRQKKKEAVSKYNNNKTVSYINNHDEKIVFKKIGKKKERETLPCLYIYIQFPTQKNKGQNLLFFFLFFFGEIT